MTKKNKKYIKRYRFPIGLDISSPYNSFIIKGRRHLDGVEEYCVLYGNGKSYWHTADIISYHIKVSGINYVEKKQ